MAKKQEGPIGPAQGGGPSGPQARIYLGGIPVEAPQAYTLRRPFTEPVRPPLHYLSGGGPDEAVSSRGPAPAPALGDAELVRSHKEGRAQQGLDNSGPPDGNDNCCTLNGVSIRGS